MKGVFKNVVIVGDRSTKLDFVCEFLNKTSRACLEKLCQDTFTAVEVIHSEDFADTITADRTTNNILVLSAVFPNGIKLSADLSETDWIYCPNAQDADLILFIEAFPFTNDALAAKIELIETYIMNELDNNFFHNVQFRVIFFKNKNQHFGDTDKVGIDEALKYAPGYMIDRLEKSSKCMLPVSTIIDFKVYDNVDDMIELVSWNMKTFKTLTAVSMEKFKQWRADIDYYCENYKQEYDYQFADSLRFEVIHNRINKFTAVKGSNDIMRRYAENYYHKCFIEIKKIALELYRQSVYGICFWDLEKDIAMLDNKLDRLCLSTLNFKEQSPCPKLQAEYQKILTEEKIDIRFSERIQGLEQDDVPKCVYQYLKKKEEILFEVLGE